MIASSLAPICAGAGVFVGVLIGALIASLWPKSSPEPCREVHYVAAHHTPTMPEVSERPQVSERQKAADELKASFDNGYQLGKSALLNSNPPEYDPPPYWHRYDYDPLAYQVFNARVAGFYAGQRHLRTNLNSRVTELHTEAAEAEQAAEVTP